MGHPVDDGPTSFLSVPLRTRGIVLGELRLTGKNGTGAFTGTDEQLLGALAAAVALVLRDVGPQRRLDALLSPSAPLLLTREDLAHLLPGTPTTISTALCTRLSVAGEPLFLLLGRPAEFPPFVDVDHEMVRSLTPHVSLALELLRVHRRREQEAVFRDRDRIARDLHDLVIQRLFAAGPSTQGLRTFLSDRDSPERIAAITAELGATIRELRDTIYSLNSVPADHSDLHLRCRRPGRGRLRRPRAPTGRTPLGPARCRRRARPGRPCLGGPPGGPVRRTSSRRCLLRHRDAPSTARLPDPGDHR